MRRGRSDEGSRILGALSADLRERLAPQLEVVELVMGAQLSEDEQRNHVYFVDRGVVSLLSRLDDERLVEIISVGREGLLGVPAVLGGGSAPGPGLVRISGQARRMARHGFRAEIERGGELRQLMQRYTTSLMQEIARRAVCNREHQLLPRCARWLLTSHDRLARARSFMLHPEYLAQTVEASTAEVIATMAELQVRGAVEYARDLVTLLDREQLENGACRCYVMSRDESASVLADGTALAASISGSEK
jgi:hypothetical protein